jgi:hypothetical protein
MGNNLKLALFASMANATTKEAKIWNSLISDVMSCHFIMPRDRQRIHQRLPNWPAQTNSQEKATCLLTIIGVHLQNLSQLFQQSCTFLPRHELPWQIINPNPDRES